MESFTLGLMRGDGAPLYRQLYRHIVEEIASGGLAAGEKLPSKRRLAADLRVSVSTVETAYQMLVAEGYIAARAKSGFTVCRIEKLDAPVRPAPAAPPEPPAKRWAYDFGTGSVDTALFPFKTWARIQRETVTAHPELLNHGSRQGDASLRAAIAKYLHAYRGVVCAPEQIVVGAGIEYLVGLLARLFCASTFAVENPGYPRTAQVLRNNGVRTVFVPVDGDGMTLDALQAGGAQLAYVTPSHQFPTGATMPIARRTELLRWAGAAPGRYVVEDDYDSEFRYDTRPIPSLQGLDQAGRVIYVSTFSKSMAPSMRIGYMVLPEKLMERYISTMNFYSCTVSGFEQYAMAAFLEQGYFERHIRRLINDYRGQRERICRMFRKSPLSRISQIYQDDAGTHFLLHVRTDLSDVEIKWAARQRGILVNCLSEYCFADAQRYRGILVIHYSDMEDEVLQKVIGALEEIFL